MQNINNYNGYFMFLWRYLKSTIGNIQLINSFRQADVEKKEEKAFSFWMEFFIESIKEEYTNNQFPVSSVHV